MGVAFDVVHHEHHPVFGREIFNRTREFFLQVRLRHSLALSQRTSFVQLEFPLTEPLDLAQPVVDHRCRYRSEPGTECSFTAELIDPVECADERILRELLSEFVITG